MDFNCLPHHLAVVLAAAAAAAAVVCNPGQPRLVMITIMVVIRIVSIVPGGMPGQEPDRTQAEQTNDGGAGDTGLA